MKKTFVLSETSMIIGVGYVRSLEQMDINSVTKTRTEVAMQVLQDEFDENNLSFDEWKRLESRIALIQEQLIELDRW